LKLKKMKQKTTFPAVAREKMEKAFEELKKEVRVIDPKRNFVVYLLGMPKAGKSSLINALIDNKVCAVGEKLKSKTTKFAIHTDAATHMTYVDSQGVSSDEDFKQGCKQILRDAKQAQKDGAPFPLPDLIFLCTTPDMCEGSKQLGRFVDMLRDVAKKQGRGKVPVVLVVTKLDTKPNDSPLLEDVFTDIKEELDELFPADKYDMKLGVSTERNNHGIQDLKNILNNEQQLQDKVTLNDKQIFENCRENLAMKIIAAFSGLCATVSIIPFADIPIVLFLTSVMLDILACFSLNDKTAESFLIAHSIRYGVVTGIRAGLMILGDVLELSVVGFLVGTGVNMASAGGLTAAIGWHAYKYFTTV